MEEENQAQQEAKPRFAMGELLLAAIVAHIAFTLLGLPSPGPVIPFAVLAGIWYGGTKGFLVGAIGFAFSEMVLFSITTQTWFNTVLGGIAGLLGIGGNESNFLIRVMLATALFEIVLQLYGSGFVLQTGYYMDKLPGIVLHFAVNGITAIGLVYYLRPKKSVSSG